MRHVAKSSVRLQAGVLDELSPTGGVGTYEFRHLRWCHTGDHMQSLIDETRAQLRAGQAFLYDLVDPLDSNSVWPSAGARAASSAARLPAAPDRLSTTTV